VIYLLYVIHILVCIFLILVVLLQQGKGADLSVFGGGTSQAAFGARGATTLLHKLTVASFIVFVLTTMGITMMQGGGRGSVMTGVAAEAPATPAPATPAQPNAQQPAPPSATPAAPATPANPPAPAPANPGQGGGANPPAQQ
jgi:preprotein translocase subunit SecG